jgi:hypothetical protein
MDGTFDAAAVAKKLAEQVDYSDVKFRPGEIRLSVSS